MTALMFTLKTSTKNTWPSQLLLCVNVAVKVRPVDLSAESANTRLKFPACLRVLQAGQFPRSSSGLAT